MTLPVVTLFGRPGCCLCDEARAHLMRLRAGGVEFSLVERDISADDDLHRRYLERIPVVAVDGREVFELDDDPAVLVRELAPTVQ